LTQFQKHINPDIQNLIREDAAQMENTAQSVLSDELAVLALRTAQEVDRRLSGGNLNPSILFKFGEKLSEASGVDGASETALLYSDPKTTEIFSRAIEESSDESVSDLDSLRESIKGIIAPLIGNKEGLSIEALTLVRSFCLAFHRSLAAQRLPRVSEREKPFNEATGFYR
jgi:hypothetical protein